MAEWYVLLLYKTCKQMALKVVDLYQRAIQRYRQCLGERSSDKQ